MNFRKLELEDQPWFPAFIKEDMTDYLRFLFQTFDLYHPVEPILGKLLAEKRIFRVVDLCSGSGGAVTKVQQALKEKYGLSVTFVLTDISPRLNSWKYLAAKSSLGYISYSVDATNVSGQIKGFRTIFSGIHHFDANGVRAVIGNAVAAGEGIAIFDGGNKNFGMVLLILLFHPFAIFLFTPFIKPFRWSRLVFTYLVPLITLGAVWDGIISVINLYRPEQLLALAREASGHYHWEAGQLINRFGLKINYLTGIPANLCTFVS